MGPVPKLMSQQELNGAVCYTWDSPRGPLSTVWSQGHPGRARLASTAPEVTIIDLMGNEEVREIRGDSFTMRLSSRPFYLLSAGDLRLAEFMVDEAFRNPQPPAPQLGENAPKPILREQVPLTEGLFGQAPHFIHDKAGLAFPVDADLFWEHQGTIELWFRPDKPLTEYFNRYLIRLTPIAGTPFKIGPGSEIVGGSSYVRFWVDGGFISASLSSGVDRWVMFPQQREWEAGTWHQVVLTWTEHEAREYLDGELVKTQEITPLSPFRDSRMYVGCCPQWGGGFQEALEGTIDGLRTYSRVKSTEELAQDYEAGLRGEKPSDEGLLWEMDLGT